MSNVRVPPVVVPKEHVKGVHRLTAVLLLAAMSLLAGCGGDGGNLAARSTETQAPTQASLPSPELVKHIPRITSASAAPVNNNTYLAEVGPAGSTYLALVTQGEALAVYVCDGETLSDWFGGSVKNDRFSLRSPSGTVIDGVVADGKVLGNITLPDSSSGGYEARRAEGGRTGLFLHDDYPDIGFKARWIVTTNGVRGLSSDESGTTKGAVATSTTASGSGGTSSGSPATTGATSAGPTSTAQPAAVRGGSCVNAFPGGCAFSCDQLRQGLNEANNLVKSGLLTKEGLKATQDLAFDFMTQFNINGCKD